MPGRSGRGADRNYPGSCAPRYLSMAPPILPFATPPPLKGNKYELLSKDEYPGLKTVRLSDLPQLHHLHKLPKIFSTVFEVNCILYLHQHV